jgi:hypothetical protein
MDVRKTLINQVVIDIEGSDLHEIEAFVNSINLMSKRPISINFPFPGHSKYFGNLDFKNSHFLKILKNEQKHLSVPHILKVSFWDLNGIIFFRFVLHYVSTIIVSIF